MDGGKESGLNRPAVRRVLNCLGYLPAEIATAPVAIALLTGHLTLWPEVWLLHHGSVGLVDASGLAGPHERAALPWLLLPAVAIAIHLGLGWLGKNSGEGDSGAE